MYHLKLLQLVYSCCIRSNARDSSNVSNSSGFSIQMFLVLPRGLFLVYKRGVQVYECLDASFLTSVRKCWNCHLETLKSRGIKNAWNAAVTSCNGVTNTDGLCGERGENEKHEGWALRRFSAWG